MDFVSNQEPQIKEMLKTLEVNSIDDLFSAVPEKLKLPKPSNGNGLSEYEGICLLDEIAHINTYPQYENYLGAGAYEHHIPSIVGAICGKSEFLTAYTPYQAEASQGMLQAIFEFQSAICALTGMDVANASLYDGASACAEAVLMALRIQKNRDKIQIAESVHPHYRDVVQTYLKRYDVVIETISSFDQIDENAAAILVQYPNFFGEIDDIKTITEKLFTIVCANPLVYGLYASAGELGADIAVGDGQPFGIPLQFGGPYVGYMACKQEYVRQMPGRLVGETVDTEGKRGFVLTLQAREQHIRREKATSNICTNQSLAALASLVAMLWYGKEGLSKLAKTNFQRANYLKDQLEKFPHITSLSSSPILNEFAIKFNRPIDEVLRNYRENGIEPGVPLGKYYPHLKDYLLVAVTETKNKKSLDHYIDVAKTLA